MGSYQELHSHLHHPVRPLRIFYCCSNQENLLAWVSISYAMDMFCTKFTMIKCLCVLISVV